MIRILTWWIAVGTAGLVHCNLAKAESRKRSPPPQLLAAIRKHCSVCHDGKDPAGGLNLAALSFDLHDRNNRRKWVRIHDRIEKGEMPPKGQGLSPQERNGFAGQLRRHLLRADTADVASSGRGPGRRLNRSEYERNLRDVLLLPELDVRDMLPEDRQAGHFNKTTAVLDVSRVQVTAWLDAAEAALLKAMASGVNPPARTRYRAEGSRLFSTLQTFGTRKAMFFAKKGKAVTLTAKEVAARTKRGKYDPDMELALFRSAHWPYYGYPKGFVAARDGAYRIKFSARAVVQLPGFRLQPSPHPIPMTFRARKPSGPDVSGDVRATGGWMDIQAKTAAYAATIRLKAGETFEYSLLGLPVPLARNVNNGPPTYRYPPFPEKGQPGVAFQWLEVEGPLSPNRWPPPSHGVLFGDLPIRAGKGKSGLPVDVISAHPQKDARRLLRNFVKRAARRPVSEESLGRLERLIASRLAGKSTFAEAMLTGYKAFLCSPDFLYLNEPQAVDDHFAIASRLSHFLSETRPDERLQQLARRKRLRDPRVLRREADRLIDSVKFQRFVENFTDYWLDLRHLHRDAPDVRLYPEYRFDAYLTESMGRETRAFFADMVRDNRPAVGIVKGDYVFANDRLARHYGLDPLQGSAIRKVPLPKDSPYGGLMTQGAILKVTANGTNTSPVVRGAWIMDRLSGRPPPPPPAAVPAVEPDIRGAQTIRQQLALHAGSAACAACHAKFDPLGAALENFDVMGGWRSRYRGIEQGLKVTGIDRAGHDFSFALTSKIDAAGKLEDGRRFQNVHELKRLLASEERGLASNLLHRFTIYATGTPVRFADRPHIEAILDASASKGYRVRDLLHGLIASKIFLGPPGRQKSD